jgi:hypothetical protein
VKVGSGVNVLRGVNVTVGVAVAGGIAAIVCRDAASAVWAIYRLIAFGSRVEIGEGVGNAGMHETRLSRRLAQRNSFLEIVIFGRL